MPVTAIFSGVSLSSLPATGALFLGSFDESFEPPVAPAIPPTSPPPIIHGNKLDAALPPPTTIGSNSSKPASSLNPIRPFCQSNTRKAHSVPSNTTSLLFPSASTTK